MYELVQARLQKCPLRAVQVQGVCLLRDEQPNMARF